MDIQILLALQDLREAIGGCLNSFFAFLTTIAVDYYIMLPGLILFWAVNKRSGAIGLGAYGAACYGVSALKCPGRRSARSLYSNAIRISMFI